MQGKEKEEDEVGVASDGTDRAALGRGQYAGKQARKFAAELGLDVYSSNQYVQALIQEVVMGRAKGSLGVSVGLFFLTPFKGLGLLGGALTPAGLEAETENLIRDEGPAELRLVLIEKYKRELGLEYKKESAVKALLDNPNYSPREQAYINLHFRRLGRADEGRSVVGIEDAVAYLGTKDTPNRATFGATQMELYSAYQRHEKDLVRFVVTPKILGAVTEKNKLLFIIPYDIVGRSPYVLGFLDDAVKVAQAQHAKGTELWFTGDVMGGFVSEAKRRGFKVKESVLTFPYFALD
ncbi:MAG: hypothetical protein ACE5KK_04415 [Candidatus Brocadiales bacterium]